MSKLLTFSKHLVDFLQPYAVRAVYAGRIELKPPSPADLPAIQQSVKQIMHAANTGSWRHLTVKQCIINAVVVGEIAIWFFAGEIIGRRSFTGYAVDV